MNYVKSFIYLMTMAFVLSACEQQNDTDGDKTGFDDSKDQNNGEPKFEAELSYGGEVFTFDLSGDELTDKVVFLSNQLYFKVSNKRQQVLHIKLAGPVLYSSSSGTFRALPVLPYNIDEKLAYVSFYDPTEQPLTNASTKYLIDDEVVVNEFTENSIILAYDGDAITGAQLNNTDEGKFNILLELTYSDFEIQDMR